jgi:acetate kinase
MKEPSEPKSEALSLLTVTGGSASIKFALFLIADISKRILAGPWEGIGLPKDTFAAKEHGVDEEFTRLLSFVDHAAGIPMSTRSGDFYSGLSWYLEQREHVIAKQFHLQFAKDRNKANEALISGDSSPVMARMIHTGEESIIAKAVWQLLSRAH